MAKPLYLLHAHATRSNVGDDAIVAATYAVAPDAFPDREVHFLDVARNQISYPGEPVVAFLPLYEYHRPRYWGRVLSCIRRADAVLIGGGELLAGGIEFLGLGLLGWASGLPVVWFGMGVDVERASWLNRHYTAFVVRRARILVVRDDVAASELRSLGVPADRIQVAPDIALALPMPDLSAQRPDGRPRVGVSLRPPQNAEYPLGEPELHEVARLLDRLVETHGATILLLPFLDQASPIKNNQSPFGTDREVLARVAALMHRGDQATLYTGSLHPTAILGVLAGLDGLIAMRLHATILGLKAGLLPLAIEYAPKVRRALTRLGLGHRVVRIGELGEPGTADRVLAGRGDPEAVARLAEEARRHLTLVTEHVSAGRGMKGKGAALRRLPLAVLALLIHSAITLYAALPPFRLSRWRRSRQPVSPQ